MNKAPSSHLVSVTHDSDTSPVPGEGSLRVIAQVSGLGLGAAGA